MELKVRYLSLKKEMDGGYVLSLIEISFNYYRFFVALKIILKNSYYGYFRSS